jgi:hypothetical protein
MQQIHLMPSGGLSACKLHERLQDTAAQRFGDMKDFHDSLMLPGVVRDLRDETGGLAVKEVVSPSVGFRRFDVGLGMEQISTAVEHRG